MSDVVLFAVVVLCVIACFVCMVLLVFEVCD